MPRAASGDAHLAYVLRAERQRQGLSQEALAHEVGLTVGSYARIERAQANPGWGTVRRIASALGLSLAELGRAIDERGDTS